MKESIYKLLLWVARIFRSTVEERTHSTGFDCSLIKTRKGQIVLTKLSYTPWVDDRITGNGWIRWWLIYFEDGLWEWYPISFFRNHDRNTGVYYRNN